MDVTAMKWDILGCGRCLVGAAEVSAQALVSISLL